MRARRPLTRTEEASLIDITREVAKGIIMPRFRNLSEEDVEPKSSASDLVTVADRKAEETLTQSISTLLPDAEIIGEEAVAKDPELMKDLGQYDQLVVTRVLMPKLSYACDRWHKLRSYRERQTLGPRSRRSYSPGSQRCEQIH